LGRKSKFPQTVRRKSHFCSLFPRRSLREGSHRTTSSTPRDREDKDLRRCFLCREGLLEWDWHDYDCLAIAAAFIVPPGTAPRTEILPAVTITVSRCNARPLFASDSLINDEAGTLPLLSRRNTEVPCNAESVHDDPLVCIISKLQPRTTDAGALNRWPQLKSS
jgi:hypothetical protein